MKIYCDYPTPWQATFQDPATPYMEGLINLHHDIMFILLILSGLVFWMLFKTLYAFDSSRNPVPSKVVHASTLEIVWTILPSLVLVVIALPSFTLLYSLEETADPAITLKAIGRQWYWTYEYTDYEMLLESLSYLIATWFHKMS